MGKFLKTVFSCPGKWQTIWSDSWEKKNMSLSFITEPPLDINKFCPVIQLRFLSFDSSVALFVQAVKYVCGSSTFLDPRKLVITWLAA